MKPNNLVLDLRLLDGAAGGAAAGAGAATGASAEGASAAAGQTNSRAKNNPLAGVVYGKQDAEPAAAGQAEHSAPVVGQSNTMDQKKADWDALIKGEYRDLYQDAVSSIVKQRIGETKELQTQLSKQKAVMDMLSQKYGEKDVDKLLAAIEEDDSYYEEEANRRNMPVEALKELKKMERENAAFREAEEEARRRQNADQTYQNWMNEAAQAKAMYPDFDFDIELGNAQFASLLKAGVPVTHAYQVVHMDDIIGGAMHYTAQQVAKATTDSIRARGMRPAENGSAAAAPANVKSDVSKLTKADRAEIARRASRGEKIRF